VCERLNIAEFRVLSEYVQEVCGLRFADDKYAQVAEVIVARMSEWGFRCFSDYLRMLRSSPGGKDELTHLATLLTVGETYFFRNKEHWRAFEEFALPWLVQRSTATGRRQIRIWSAGCSTGEEAYTAGIVLRRSLPDLARWSVEIIGTDISLVAIAAARKAVYTQNSFRGVPPEVRRQYFEQVGGGRYRLSADVREMACFRKLNLLDGADMRRMREVDVIFCRNVLIYFNATSAGTVLAHFHRSLLPGGYLFLGPTEHLYSSFPGFASLEVCNTFVYRSVPHNVRDITSDDTVEQPQQESHRLGTAEGFAEGHRPSNGRGRSAIKGADGAKGAGCDQDEAQAHLSASAAAAVHDETAFPPATATAEGKPSLDDLRLRAVGHLCAEENAEARRVFQEILQRAPDDMQSLLGTAIVNAGRGDGEPALEHCYRVLQKHPLCAEAYCVMALVHEALGDNALAQRELEKAIYLDGGFSIAHFRLVGLHDRLGRPDAAERELNNVLKALPDDDEQRVRVYSGGFDKGTIRRICEQRLGVESATV
jgi:chemotaxis protein methyltransferase CheR